MRTNLKLVALTLVAVAGCREMEQMAPGERWEYAGEFHKAIAKADKIVVRDGGFNCCQPVDKDKILFQVTDGKKVKEVYDHIQFQTNQEAYSCECCGYPGIDWYKGKRRIALTSVKHGAAIRWKGFPGDADLTKESADWLREWLTEHGLTDEQIRHGAI